MSNAEKAGRGIPADAPSVSRNVRRSLTKRHADMLVIAGSMFLLGFILGVVL